MAGLTLPLMPVAAPVRPHRAAPAPGRDAAREIVAADGPPPGQRDVLAPARRPLRHRQLPPRAAAGRARGDPAARHRRSCRRRSVHRRALRRGPQRRPGELLPALADVPIADSFNGLFSFTPDGLPLLGDSRVRGLWIGSEAVWVTHAGGAGRAMADRMVDGHTDVDLHECDPQPLRAHALSRAYSRPAAPSTTARSTTSSTRCQPTRAAAAAAAQPPFHDRAVALGARFFEARGWERPQWYEANAALCADDVAGRATTGPARHWSPIAGAEHQAMRERVGLFDMIAAHAIEVHRPGALGFLQRAGRQRRRPAGRRDRLHRVLDAARRHHVRPDRSRARARTASGRHRRRGRTPRPGLDAPQPARGRLGRARGPHVGDLLRRALGATGARRPGRARRRRRLERGVPVHRRRCELHVGYVPVRALRLSYVGELGWELYAPTEHRRSRCGTRCGQAGQEHGIIAAGGAAFDSLRLEKGYRLWGPDMTTSTTRTRPASASRSSSDKGDFVGREALAGRRGRVTPPAGLPGHRRPERLAHGQGAGAHDGAVRRLRDERRLRLHVGHGDRLRASCRPRWPSPARRSIGYFEGESHGRRSRPSRCSTRPCAGAGLEEPSPQGR